MAIGAILGRIFGSGEVIKAGVSLIDDLHTSREEEILAVNQAKVNLLEAYAPFKLAQRVLAFSFTGVYLTCFSIVLTLTMLGKGHPDDVLEVMGQFYIAEITLTIVIFYFGAGAAEGVINARSRGKPHGRGKTSE